MIVGIAREQDPGEKRVALVPGSVQPLVKAGLQVLVEEGAGDSAGYPMAEYQAKGAETVSRADLFGRSDVILQINGPGVDAAAAGLEHTKQGQVMIGMQDPLGNPQGTAAMAAAGVTAFSLELVPRITRREWLSRSLIRSHFWFSVYGGLAIVMFTIFGGLIQGLSQEEWRQPWQNAVATTRPYAVGTTFAWALLLFSNTFFLFHLALMWLRLGRRSSHPTLLVHTHDETGPHGPEGDIDNVGTPAG